MTPIEKRIAKLEDTLRPEHRPCRQIVEIVLDSKTGRPTGRVYVREVESRFNKETHDA